jgi:hypothetical protein
MSVIKIAEKVQINEIIERKLYALKVKTSKGVVSPKYSTLTK